MRDKLISGRQVINAILDNKELFKFPEDIQRFAVIIEDLPSMDKLRGEWIDYRPYNIPLFDCSICGYHVKKMSNFCPNCGVRMKGIENE